MREEIIAIINNMKANGYATQYDAEFFADNFDLEMVKKWEKRFFEFLSKNS